MLSPELESLRSRVLYAVAHGYSVAYAAQYVARLGGVLPPHANATEYLLEVLVRMDQGLDLEPVTAREPATNPPPPPELPVEVEIPVPTDLPNIAHMEPLEAPVKGRRGKKTSG